MKAERVEPAVRLEGINDPLRAAMLTSLLLRPASAAELASELEAPLGRVRYQLGRLRKLGLVELKEQRPRRGVRESVYTAPPNLLSRADMSGISPVQAEMVITEILKRAVWDTLAALKAGSFVAREEWMIVRVPLRLDARGWIEAADLHEESLTRLLQLHRESEERLRERGEEPIEAFSFLMFFEAAHGTQLKDES